MNFRVESGNLMFQQQQNKTMEKTNSKHGIEPVLMSDIWHRFTDHEIVFLFNNLCRHSDVLNNQKFLKFNDIKQINRNDMLMFTNFLYLKMGHVGQIICQIIISKIKNPL